MEIKHILQPKIFYHFLWGLQLTKCTVPNREGQIEGFHQWSVCINVQADENIKGLISDNEEFFQFQATKVNTLNKCIHL